MKHKGLMLSATALAVALVLVSCEPVRGSAVEIGAGEQVGIYDYLQAGNDGLVNIDFALDEDEDGNRSTRVKIYAIQKLAFQEQAAFYDGLDFSVAPDSVTISGGGGAGFYRTEQNGEVKPVTISTLLRQGNSGVFVSAPDFTFSITAPQNYYTKVEQSDLPDRLRWICQSYYTTGASSARELVGTGIGQSVQFASYTNYNTVYFGMWKQQIPVLNGVLPGSAGSSSPAIIGGLGESVQLPQGTIDTNSPWDYYNNVLLPHMQDEFPGYDEYFVFPDGYTVPEPPPQVPTEFPTLPGFDFGIPVDGTLPADAGNTAYDMPEIPTKPVPIPAFDLTTIKPAEILAPFADGFKGLWSLIADTLSSFGLLPVAALCFLVLIVCAFLALGVK